MEWWIEWAVHVLPLVVSLSSRLSSPFCLIMPKWWSYTCTPLDFDLRQYIFIWFMECWLGWVVHVLPNICPYISNLFHNLEHGYYMYSSVFWSLASIRTISNIPLVFKAIFTVLADSTKWMVVHVLLCILILGYSKIQSTVFNLIFGMLTRMGSACTTPHIPSHFKAFVNLLAECAI